MASKARKGHKELFVDAAPAYDYNDFIAIIRS